LKLATALGMEPASLPLILGEITADDLMRMKKLSDSVALVRSRLTDEEWAEVEGLWTDTQWLFSIAEAISAFDDAVALCVPAEPLPKWNALTPQNQRLVRDLVRQLADANTKLSEVTDDADQAQ